MTIQEEELESLTITSGKTSLKKGWGGQSQSKKQLTITTMSACPAKIRGKKKKQNKKQLYQKREIEREREAQSQIIMKTVEAVQKGQKRCKN